MEDNVIQFPQQDNYPDEVDVLLDGEAVEAPIPLAERADVIGLTMQSVWDIAEQAKVSRGKARRVLSAFEQYFLMRLDEAYSIGARDGALSIINKIEQAQNEAHGTPQQNMTEDEVIEMEADESSDDTPEATGREEGISPEA